MNLDILNLEWNSFPSRDRESATLVCNYLRNYGFSVHEGPIHNGFNLIDKFKPKIVYMTNSLGAKINLEVLKYARSKGCYCISTVSEGNFNESGIGQFVWGHNKEQILYEDQLLLWSDRSRNLARKYFPDISDKVKVSGATGYDRYKILSNNVVCKPEKLDKYSKIIGVGCFDFGFINTNDSRYSYFNGLKISEDEIERFKKDRDDFNDVLKKIIKSNPSVGFVLKEHPGVRDKLLDSGICECDKFDNVYIADKYTSITDLIMLSDLWISYESSTAMEAWLLGKQTALLNPNGIDFPMRHDIHKGQPNFTNEKDWIDAINKVFSTGELPGFSELSEIRKKIIKDIIEWDDGLNHVRVGNAIIDGLGRGKRCVGLLNIKRWGFIRRLLQTTKWKCSPYLRFIPAFNLYYKNIRNKWCGNELKSFSQLRMGQQLKFYKLNSLDKKDLRKIKAMQH